MIGSAVVGLASSFGRGAINDYYNQKQFERTSGLALQQQQSSQDFTAAENEKNRQFQLGLASTQYQRQVADMKAAGLNPSVMLGGHGSASGGSMVGGRPASKTNVGQARLGLVANTAQTAMMVHACKKSGAGREFRRLLKASSSTASHR